MRTFVQSSRPNDGSGLRQDLPALATYMGLVYLLLIGLVAAIRWPLSEWVVGSVYLSPRSALLGAGQLGLGALLFLIYYRTLVKSRDTMQARSSDLGFIIAWTGLFSLVLMALPTLFSHDVYSYVVYGRMVSIHGLNPYVTRPFEIPGDPFLPYVDWTNVVSVYGPAWTLLSTILTLVGGEHVLGQVLIFRSLAIAFHLGSAVAVWRILGRVRPDWQLVGTILYAWNPLALIEFAGNAHNDSMMVFFVLLGLHSHVSGRKNWAVVFLTLSALTKFITVILLPIYLIVLLGEEAGNRQRAFRLLRAVSIAVLMSIVISLPFWDGREVFRALRDAPAVSSYVNSLPELLLWSVRTLLLRLSVIPIWETDSLSDRIVKAVTALPFVVLWLRMSLPVRSIQQMITASFWLLFVYLTFVGTWFWPWYATWVIPLAALSAKEVAYKVSVLFSFSATSLYTFWFNPFPADLLRLQPLRGAVIFALPLTFLAVDFLMRRVGQVQRRSAPG